MLKYTRNLGKAVNALKRYTTHTSEETSRLGTELMKELESVSFVALYGDLGAGKTHFTYGIAKALGIDEYITSPTFTIVNEYTDGKVPMYHFDLYRLSSFDDLADIGFEEYADKPAIMFIEWPDCVPELQKMYKDRITQVKITRRDEISPQRRDIEIRRFDK
jgi:tRNA threonylcarbamoyladenosine biosynthesis protein TsaE